MYSSLDAAISDIKQFSRCKNFHYPNIPKSSNITDFKSEPKFNLSKDENYQEARAFIKDNFEYEDKYYDFIHLTKLSNLSSIIKMGGIFCMNYLKNNGIGPNLLTNELSNELDNRRNLGDYVHLSVIGDNCMLNTFIDRHKNENFAIILISPIVFFYHAFIMSDQNATANAAHIGRYSTIKNYLNFVSLYSIQEFPSYDVAQNSLYKISQAEVMIYEKIPLKFISEIIPLVRN